MAKKYFIEQDKKEDALILINGIISVTKKQKNKFIYALFQRLYIDVLKECNLIPCDIESEEMKLVTLKDSLKRFVG